LIVFYRGTILIPAVSPRLEAMLVARQYKYRALVRLDPETSDSEFPLKGGRVVVRAEHHDTHQNKMFSALVTGVHDEPLHARGHSLELTVTVVGEDAIEYLEAGDTFALWRGHDIGQGLISRRLPLWVEAP
jgi:hypothetical protein